MLDFDELAHWAKGDGKRYTIADFADGRVCIRTSLLYSIHRYPHRLQKIINLALPNQVNEWVGKCWSEFVCIKDGKYEGIGKWGNKLTVITAFQIPIDDDFIDYPEPRSSFPLDTGCNIMRLQAMSLQVHQVSMERGSIDPNRRSTNHGSLYNGPLLNAKSGECQCGCRRKPRQKWATDYCRDLAYHARDIIASPSNSIAVRLVKFLQGGLCRICGADLSKVGYELDHIIEVNEGGGCCWIDNLQLICTRPCHERKTAAYNTRRATEKRIKSTGQISLFQ